MAGVSHVLLKDILPSVRDYSLEEKRKAIEYVEKRLISFNKVNVCTQLCLLFTSELMRAGAGKYLNLLSGQVRWVCMPIMPVPTDDTS